MKVVNVYNAVIVSDGSKAVTDAQGETSEDAKADDKSNKTYLGDSASLNLSDYDHSFYSARDKDKNKSSSRVEDKSGMLCARLVTARNSLNVHTVVGDINKEIVDLKLGDPKDDRARRIVRSLEKLLHNAYRKLKDLSKEDKVSQDIVVAKRKKMALEAEKLNKQLRSMQKERYNRERGYLRDATSSLTYDANDALVNNFNLKTSQSIDISDSVLGGVPSMEGISSKIQIVV